MIDEIHLDNGSSLQLKEIYSCRAPKNLGKVALAGVYLF